MSVTVRGDVDKTGHSSPRRAQGGDTVRPVCADKEDAHSLGDNSRARCGVPALPCVNKQR